MKALTLIAIVAITGIAPFSFAEISVYQENTPERAAYLESMTTAEDAVYVQGVGRTIPSMNYTVTENMDWLIENGVLYTENRTVTLPHPVEQESCTTQWLDFFIVQTTCSFMYEHVPAEKNPHNLSTSTENGCAPGFVRDTTTDECKLPEVLEAEAKTLYEEKPVFSNPRFEDRLNELKSIENPTRTEKRIITLLENLNAVCTNDVLQIQTWRQYDVAMGEFLDPETGEIRSQLMTKKSMSAVILAVKRLAHSPFYRHE